MSVPSEVMIETGRTPVAALRWGVPGAPRVLAVHGWLESAAVWLALEPYLGSLDVVAVDLPGHGRSAPRPPVGAYHYVEWVAEIIAIVDALGWEDFALLGHSMGGGISALTAGSHPERIQRLVLIEGLYPQSAEPSFAPESVRRAVASHRKVAARPRRVYADVDEAISSRIFKPPTFLSWESARLAVPRSLEQVEGGYAYRHDRRHEAHSFIRLSPAQVEAFYAAITCPTLVLRGTEGFDPEPENSARLLAALVDASVERVDGGHWIHLDQAEVVGPMVAEFLLKK